MAADGDTMESGLRSLETALRGGHFARATRTLGRLLFVLDTRALTIDGDNAAPALAESRATRIAAAVTGMLCDPRFQPGAGEARRFLPYKRVLSEVFELSGYRGTAHLHELVRGADRPAAVRRLMGLSVNHVNAADLDSLDRLEPPARLLAVLALLSESLVWTDSAEATRTALLDYPRLPAQARLSAAELTLLGNAWMVCSYAASPRRHDIKARLNRVVAAWLQSRGVPGTPVEPAAADRPTLLIIAEIWYTGHAMDRCYRASIRGLRRRFRTVLMLASGEQRPVDESLFDEVDRTAFDAKAPERFIERARGHRPAVVYFPSVGMRIGGIAAANARIAPVQVATNGHPATTHSPCIDYMVLVEDAVGDPACFSETLLLRRAAPHYVRFGRAEIPAPDIRRHPAVVRLAVPAWIRKINPAFLAACRAIRDRARRPVEFHFFPNLQGLAFLAARRRLEEELPARVHPYMRYPEYMVSLGQCDIHLSTFPFGSSNGIVDSALLSLPIVNLLGVEIHSRLDGLLARRLQQPDWLTVADERGFVEAALRLVDDDALRVGISEAIVAGDPAAQLLVGDDGETTDFADIVHQAYLHHDAIRADGRRAWTVADLAALADDGPTLRSTA